LPFKINKILIPLAILISSIVGIIWAVRNNSVDFSRLRIDCLIWYFMILMIYYILSSMITPIFIGDKRFVMSFWLHRLSLVSSYITPVKVGLPLKIYFFKKYLSVPISKTSSSILLETSVSVVSMLLMGLMLGGYKYVIFNYNMIKYILLMILAAVILFLIFKNSRLFVRFRNFLKSICSVLKASFMDRKKFILIISILILLIFLSVARMQAIVLSLAGHFSFVKMARAVLISSFVAAISMIPGGVGVREVTLIYFLVQEGLPKEEALLVSLFDRVIVTIGGFVLGIVASFFVLKNDVAAESKALE
jgi:uncharacterized protein (TIRG00374 family)